jgi:hypothetical protein
MPRKLIAVRVDQDLYDKIKVCADYANNSMAAWCELLVKQGVSRVYGMIPKATPDVEPLEKNDNTAEN